MLKYIDSLLKEEDKILHFRYSMFMTFIFGVLLFIFGFKEMDIIVISFLATVFVGTIKEVYDYFNIDHTADIHDFAADLLGALAGCMLIIPLLFI